MLTHRPDLAQQARHLHGPSASRAALPGSLGAWEASGAIGARRVVAALSLGDGVDGSAADAQVPGDGSLGEDALVEESLDLGDNRRSQHGSTSGSAGGLPR